MPATTPDAEPAVATVLLLLLHTPPVVALVSNTVPPKHTLAKPDIAASGLTFTEVELIQPAGVV